MRALLLAVFLAGCESVAPVGSTSQALPAPGPVGKLGGSECFCMANGQLDGGILCTEGNWTCAPNDGVACGWEAQCDGGSGSVFFDWSHTGEACTGTAYTGFPDTCPELTNTTEDGQYYCSSP